MSVKIIALLAGLLALVGGVWWYGEHKEAIGDKNGAARIQALWDTNRLNIQATADAAIAQATKDKEAALAANEGIEHDLQAQLSAARASAGTYASELRDARARLAAGGRPVPQGANNPGTPSGTAAPGVGQLDVATGAALAECAEVRADYKSLIAELSPQL